MSLADDLTKLKAAMGDGKIIPIHSFIMQKDGRLWSTDGAVHASVPAGALFGEFCVHGDLLAKAAKHNGAEIHPGANADHIIIKYGPRSKLKLAALPTSTFPVTTNEAHPNIGLWSPVRPGLRQALIELMPARGDGVVSAWTSAVFMSEEFSWSASGAQAFRSDYVLDARSTSVLPTWVCDFLVNQATDPIRYTTTGRILSFYWEDGLTMHASAMTDNAPDNAWSMVTNLVDCSQALPEGFAEAVERVADFGAKSCNVNMNGISATLRAGEGNELTEEFECDWPNSTFNVELLANIMKYATHGYVADRLFYWSGLGKRGCLAGMVN